MHTCSLYSLLHANRNFLNYFYTHRTKLRWYKWIQVQYVCITFENLKLPKRLLDAGSRYSFGGGAGFWGSCAPWTVHDFLCRWIEGVRWWGRGVRCVRDLRDSMFCYTILRGYDHGSESWYSCRYPCRYIDIPYLISDIWSVMGLWILVIFIPTHTHRHTHTYTHHLIYVSEWSLLLRLTFAFAVITLT